MKFFIFFLLMFFPLFSSPRFQYLDGNGNEYILEKGILHYIPTQPVESSSGFYSGGEPYSKRLSSDDEKVLRSIFIESQSLSKEEREEQRTMGSGTVILGQKIIVLIKMNSAYQRKLEFALEGLKKR